MKLTPIKDIKPNPNNPRVIKDDKFAKLVQSLKELPEMATVRPVVVNSDMIVLGGNMRLKAMKEAGWKDVPVEIVDWDEDKQRQFIIKDNVGFGEWDWEMLANEWDAEQLEEWGLDIPTFEEEVKELEAEEDDYEMPDQITTDIVLGDLFEIGPHRLLCGDSTQTDTFAKLFDNQMADLVVTDPPYNVDYEGKTKDKLKIVNDKQKDEDFDKFLYDFFTALNTYSKPGSPWYVWSPPGAPETQFRNQFMASGLLLKQCLVWIKNCLVMGRQDYQWKHESCLEGVSAESWEWVKEHEPCLYGWKAGSGHFWKGGRKQTTVLEFDRPSKNKEHPTMKPVPLIGYQIGNSSKQGDIVADGFGGSGTTMVACHQMNRKAYLVEYDPKYCQVIVDRMLKLDPSLEVKRNGEPYKTGE